MRRADRCVGVTWRSRMKRSTAVTSVAILLNAVLKCGVDDTLRRVRKTSEIVG